MAPAAAPVSVAHDEPVKGIGFAQLQCSSDVPLALRCTQKLWLAPKLSVKLFAMFNREAQQPRLRLQAKHKGSVDVLDMRVSARVRYDHTRSVTKGTVYIKKRLELGAHTALNAKVELHQRLSLPGAQGTKASSEVDDGVEVQARVEVSHVALNATSSQGMDATGRGGGKSAGRGMFCPRMFSPTR
jgi:hypothetical protein